MKIHFSLFFLLSASLFAIGQSRVASTPTKMNTDQNISVLEFRNYLLKPNTAERFRGLFNEQFVEPMNELGGYTVGQFRIEGEADRFVWMRGFENMQTRVKFLNDFYFNSTAWKKYRTEANGMIINSDNVHLLRPLLENGNVNDRDIMISKSELQKTKAVVVVDFYVCNSRLEQVIDLFKSRYLPYLKTSGVSGTTLWVSEMTENDFPRLPVFQDKNLLVSMTTFQTEREYLSKIKQVDSLEQSLKNEMLELITSRSRLVLHSTILKP
jgi:hypothetical protein